jgi:membrane fusion protein, multidrug efflux system
MIAFLTIIYIAAVVVIFKVLKVKPRPWPIALMAVVGVVMLGAIVVLWTVAAPISMKSVVTRYVIQIVPYVKGQVVSIPAQPNVPLKKGDVLYQVDPAPYQYTVDQLTAQLAASRNNVLQLEASVRVAEAAVEVAQSNVAATKAAYDVAVAIEKENPAAIAKLKLVEAQENYAAAKAGLQQAQASVEQARAGLAAAKDTVVSVQSQLDTARFNLKECTVTAPSDGFVTDWQIQEGTFVVPMPMAAAGTFIDTSETYIVASFPAEQLIHVQPGQEVEMAFNSKPGQLFHGKVDNVIQASGEGQFTPSGKLPSAAAIGSYGFMAVKIRLDDRKAADSLALGTPGTVAIYTDWGKPFAVISKVAVRMQNWLYFLPIPGK